MSCRGAIIWGQNRFLHPGRDRETACFNGTSEGIKELFESCELTTFRKGGTGNEYS